MNTDQARDLVISLLDDIAPDGDASTLEPEQDIRRILDLDSLDFVNFVTAVEERTGLRVPESDYPLMSTVGGATDYLASALTAG